MDTSELKESFTRFTIWLTVLLSDRLTMLYKIERTADTM